MSITERLPALKSREFREFLFGNFISTFGSQIQLTAVAWHVYVLTGSSLMVGYLGLVRVVPTFLFSLLAGVVADRVDRRKILLVTQGSLMAVAALITVFTASGWVTVGWLYALVAVGNAASSFDLPARHAAVANLVPTEHYPNAASLNGIAWRTSEVGGPVVSGLVIGAFHNGLSICYLLNAFTYAAILIAILRMSPKPPLKDGETKANSVKAVLGEIREGFAFVRKTKVLSHAMWIDFWGTFLSGATAVIPAFSAILKAGPQGYGVLMASGGVGAMLAAGSMAWLPTIRKQGLWVIVMIVVYGLATIGFGISVNLWMAAFFLALAGAADMISTVIRQTIRQLSTPDEMRGRMSATSALFHVTGPKLGDFEAGLLARLTGERWSVVIGGVACMLVASNWLRAPALKDYEHQAQPTHD